jgi:hypothetical protein
MFNNLRTSHLDELSRARYIDKLRVAVGNNEYVDLPDPYSLTVGWTCDVAAWPNITFGDVYAYLIDSPGVYTKESLKAYKSLEAYSYLPFVETVWCNTIKVDSPVCLLKARVRPSQRISDKPHEPWIVVNKQTGSVLSAHCTCKAG